VYVTSTLRTEKLEESHRAPLLKVYTRIVSLTLAALTRMTASTVKVVNASEAPYVLRVMIYEVKLHAG
jgi:hypothetical protein